MYDPLLTTANVHQWATPFSANICHFIIECTCVRCVCVWDVSVYHFQMYFSRTQNGWFPFAGTFFSIYRKLYEFHLQSAKFDGEMASPELIVVGHQCRRGNGNLFDYLCSQITAILASISVSIPSSSHIAFIIAIYTWRVCQQTVKKKRPNVAKCTLCAGIYSNLRMWERNTHPQRKQNINGIQTWVLEENLNGSLCMVRAASHVRRMIIIIIMQNSSFPADIPHEMFSWYPWKLCHHLCSFCVYFPFSFRKL